MKTKFLTWAAAGILFGFAACNNDSDGDAANDTTGLDNNTATTTNTNTTDYAARADSFRVNSEQGNYLDPKTGKALRINYDPQTRMTTNAETGEPVWRYVDRRTWWVYGSDTSDNWTQQGEARMEGNRIMYRGDNDQWVNYDNRWATDDKKRRDDWKARYGDTKVKIGDDGDIKVKDKKTGDKIKYDADDDKIKVDTSR